jgi:hypothetical protein
MLKPIVLLVMGLAGWALGRTRPAVNLPWLALTLFAAVTAHSSMQSAFVDTRLHDALGDPRDDANAAVVVLIAAGEAVGLWVTFLLVPWARFTARCWVSLYMLGAATGAALAFYFPFDPDMFSSGLIAPEGPPYLLAAIVCLPVAAVGYLMGWVKQVTTGDDG